MKKVRWRNFPYVGGGFTFTHALFAEDGRKKGVGIPLDDEGGPEIDADKRNTRVLTSRLKEERIQRVASWIRILCFMLNILPAKTILFQVSPNSDLFA